MECRNKRWLSGWAALLLLIPGAIASQTPTPVSKSPPKTEVDRLVFKGVKSVDLDDLRLSLYTEQSHCTSWILTPLCLLTHAHYVFARRYLDHDELKRDVLRAEVFYWKRGFRETAVDTTVVPRGSDGAVVTFLVNEGPPTLVSDITVTQKQPILTDREISSRVVLGKGTPLNLLRLDSSRVFLQQRLWDKGYADAVIDTTLVIDTAAHAATINNDLDPKWKATVSDIIVEGNKKVQTRTILKSLTLKPGSLFRRSELLRSQRALYESNLFKRAAIEIPKQGDSSKVLIVTVTEAPLHEARASFGFNTIDFFQVEGRYTHYNFFGRARRLDFQAAVGNLFANALNGRFIFRDAFSGVISRSSVYLQPTYNASVNFTEPWYGAPQNNLQLSFFSHRRSSPGIFIDRGFGSSATFTREVLERAPVSLNYRFELNRVDAGDVYFCINYGVCDQATLGALRNRQKLSPLTLTGNIDRANDPYSPTQGYRAEADIEHASSFTLSDFRYNRATTDAAVYHKVRSRGSIAGHLRLGWVSALESTESAIGVASEGQILHPRKRFYAGGSRSVRGFGENQLGPRVLTIPAARLRRKDPACTPDVDITTCNPNAADIVRTDFEPRPLGGNFVAESSIEYRFPLWRQVLVGAVFADGGYVSQKTSPDLPKSRAAITPGFGVRYRSPVGPIRVDFGINPGRKEELPVVTEETVNGVTRLVTLDQRRSFSVGGSGARGFLDRLVLHLSIGEAF
jgi:outer membrane protein insertion porin family/translocation and assembly module TamA